MMARWFLKTRGFTLLPSSLLPIELRWVASNQAIGYCNSRVIGPGHRSTWLLGIVVALFATIGCGEHPQADGDSDQSTPGLVSDGTTASRTTDSTTAAPVSPANSSASVLTSGQNSDSDTTRIEDAISARKSGRQLWLGIQAEPAPKALLDQFELSCGLVVRQVVAGGPSEGLLQDSDLITQFNGRDLACQKRLCSMIAELGPQLTRLTVIRKTKQLQVDVLPQPIEFLCDGQIVQYTVLADPDSTDVVDVPVDGNTVVERFRLFVVQPILAMGEVQDQRKLEADPGELKLERVVKFGTDQGGKKRLTVQESGRTLYYTADDIEQACPEVQQLWQHLENTP